MKLLVRFCNLKFINKILCILVNTRFSKIFIPAFKRHYKINTQEILPGQKFKSLNDYFARAIDMDYRPMGAGKYISPCDGVITAGGNISPGMTFEVKGKMVDVPTLLNRQADVKAFQVIYLSPHNYHRFHAIDDNEVVGMYEFGDKSIPVNDLGFEMGNPFLDNYRVILETEDYFYIAIGATNVNSVKFFKGKFKKGECIGEFRFGSTIVILYKEDIKGLKLGEIKVREDLGESS